MDIYVKHACTLVNFKAGIKLSRNETQKRSHIPKGYSQILHRHIRVKLWNCVCVCVCVYVCVYCFARVQARVCACEHTCTHTHTHTHTHTTHTSTHTIYVPHGNDRPVVVRKVVHHLKSHLSLQVAGSHVHEVFNNKTQNY